MNTLTLDEVRAIRTAAASRYTGDDVTKATRTEIHAALQLKNPAPYSERVAYLSAEERAKELAVVRAQPTDAECIDFARNRGAQPHIVDAHHWVQMKHGTALWTEAGRLLAQLGGTS